jgi:hypothetical protein
LLASSLNRTTLTPRQKAAQWKLISAMFALRDFHLVVDRGVLGSLAFAEPPTRH